MALYKHLSHLRTFIPDFKKHTMYCTFYTRVPVTPENNYTILYQTY